MDSEIKQPKRPGQIKETGNQFAVAALFNKMQPSTNTPRSRELLAPSSSSRKRKLAEETNNQEDGLDVTNEITSEIVFGKVAPQTTGPPMLEDLSKSWATESKNDEVIKKLKSDYQFHLIAMKFSLQSKIKKFRKIKIYHS